MELERIPFKNLQEPSISEEILEALQDNINKAINTKPIIKARTNRQSISTSGSYGTTVLPINSIEFANDNAQGYLSVANNAIFIGANVHIIKVTAHTRGIQTAEGGEGDKEFLLRKNEETVEGYYQKNLSSGWWGAEINTDLIVSQGDKIDIAVQSQASGTFEMLETYLQVEVIK